MPVSDTARQTIDSLTKDELRVEVNRGARSRFQGDNYAYAKSRLEILEADDQAADRALELGAAEDANAIARKSNEIAEGANRVAEQANQLAHEANATAKSALHAARLSALVAVVAIIVAMCAKT